MNAVPLRSRKSAAGVVSARCPYWPPPLVDVMDMALALISLRRSFNDVVVGVEVAESDVSSGCGNWCSTDSAMVKVMMLLMLLKSRMLD